MAVCKGCGPEKRCVYCQQVAQLLIIADALNELERIQSMDVVMTIDELKVSGVGNVSLWGLRSWHFTPEP